MPTPRRATTPASSDKRFDKKEADVNDIPKPLWNSAPNELPPFLLKLGRVGNPKPANIEAQTVQTACENGKSSPIMIL